MRIGDIDLVPLNDGVCRLPPGFWVDFDWSTHPDLLNADGQIEIPIGCFLVRTGDRVVLLDAGMGPVTLPWGEGGALLHALAAEGVRPGDVDTVVCTHLHVDHIGWLHAFPNATVRFGRGDLDHFAEDGRVAEMLHAVSGRVELIDGDHVALAPGLTARHTPGHTPGHYGLVVSSGEDRAVLLGDAVECPLQLDEPDFYAMSDVDPALAKRTREALWRELEGTPALVGAAHFPGLEFGRVLRGSGRRWFPYSKS